MRRIQRALSEARFIHVIRDGRDTAAARPGELDPGKALTIGTRWERKVASARNQQHLVNHYIEIRYEDLVADPEPILRRVSEYIELDFDPAMVTHPSAPRSKPSSAPRVTGAPSSGARTARPSGKSPAACSASSATAERRSATRGSPRQSAGPANSSRTAETIRPVACSKAGR